MIYNLIFRLLLVFWVSYLGIHDQIQAHEDVLLCSLLSTLASGLIFRLLIHF